MGQKVNPAGLRLGINKDWTAKWYAPSKDFSATLENDMKKNQIAKDNNIPLVRIPYWKRDEITMEILFGAKYEI